MAEEKNKGILESILNVPIKRSWRCTAWHT